MPEEIITVYKADIEQFKTQLRTLEGQVAGFETKAGKSSQAFSSGLKKTVPDMQGFQNVVRNVGATIGIAFGASTIIEFAKSTVRSAREAEDSIRKLSFAVKSFANGTDGDIDILIEQSKKLQEQGIFSDEQIQKAQTVALTLGLNVEQAGLFAERVNEIAASNGDFEGTLDKLRAGVTGQTRGLKELGVIMQDTGSKTQNLNGILEKTTSFVGSMEKALATSSGQAKNLENRFDELQEQIGNQLIKGMDNLKASTLDVIDAFSDLGDVDTFDELNQKIVDIGQAFITFSTGGLVTFEGTAADALKTNREFKTSFDELSASLGGDKLLALKRTYQQLTDAAAEGSITVDEFKTKQGLVVAELQKIIEQNSIIKKQQDDSTKDDGGAAAAKALEDAQKKIIENRKKLAEINIALIEDERERELAAVKFGLEEELALVTGNSKLENNVRTQLRLLAEQKIADINKKFDKQDLDDKLDALKLKQNAELFAQEDNGKNTLELQKDQLREELDLTLQNTELTQDERLSAIADTNRKIGELTVKALNDEVKAYEEKAAKEKEIDQKAEEEKAVRRQQSIDALFELADITLELADELRAANLERDVQHLETQKETELAALEDQFAKKLISEEDYNLRKGELEAKFDAQKLELERKAAKREKLAKIFSIAIQTAENAVKALGVPPVPNFVLSAIAVAAGLAQSIAVAAKPLPFAKGTKSVPGIDYGYDTVPAILRPREKVFDVDTSLAYGPALDAIFDHRIAPDVMNAVVGLASGKNGTGANMADSLVLQQMMDYHRMSKAIHKGMFESTTVLYDIRDRMGDSSKERMFNRRKI